LNLITGNFSNEFLYPLNEKKKINYTTATTTTTISGLCKIVKGNLSFFLKNQAFTTQNQSNYKKIK